MKSIPVRAKQFDDVSGMQLTLSWDKDALTFTMIPVEAVNGNLELLELAEWKGENSLAESSNGYRVYQNYPNPFSVSTVVSFEMPKSEVVTIEIYDMLGKEVAEITKTYSAGRHDVQLHDKLYPGVYYLRFRAGSYSRLIKMLHL